MLQVPARLDLRSIRSRPSRSRRGRPVDPMLLAEDLLGRAEAHLDGVVLVDVSEQALSPADDQVARRRPGGRPAGQVRPRSAGRRSGRRGGAQRRSGPSTSSGRISPPPPAPRRTGGSSSSSGAFQISSPTSQLISTQREVLPGGRGVGREVPHLRDPVEDQIFRPGSRSSGRR